MVDGRWSRIAEADHPDRYVKTTVVNAHLSWRRRWSVRHVFVAFTGDEWADSTPDHAASDVDYDDVWQRLATLPRQQRAVLVLRYYEGVPDAELAAIFGLWRASMRQQRRTSVLVARAG